MSHLPYDDLPETTLREIQRRKETSTTQTATPAEKKTDSSTSFPGHLAARGM